MTLLPVSSVDRPAVVTYQGGVVFVSIHDLEYRRQRLAWRAKLAAAHPDAGGTDAEFRTLHTAYERWYADELAWYATYGLQPPAKPARIEPARFVTPKVGQRILEALTEPRTVDDLAARCHITRRHVMTAVRRLRKLGAPILTFKQGRGGYYVLGEPWERPAECVV